MTQWSSRWKAILLAMPTGYDRTGCSEGEREQRSRGDRNQKGEKTHIHFASEIHCSPNWASAQEKDTQAEEAVSLTTCRVHWPSRGSAAAVGMNWHVWSGLQDGLWTKREDEHGISVPWLGSNLHSCIGRQSLNYWTSRESLYLLFLMQLVPFWS